MSNAFESVLNRKSTEIKPPEPLPVGNYTVQFFGRPVFQDNSKSAGKASYVEFPCKIVAIGDNVDQEQAANFKGGLMGHEIKGFSGARFYTSDDALWRLVEFMTDALGIDKGTEDSPRSLKDMVFEVPGKACLITIKQEPSQDGKRMQSRIDGFAKL